MHEPPNYVKCPRCNRLYFTVSEQAARADVAWSLAQPLSHNVARAPFERYLSCYSCGADTATFLPAVESDAPAGVTIQPVVMIDGTLANDAITALGEAIRGDLVSEAKLDDVLRIRAPGREH